MSHRVDTSELLAKAKELRVQLDNFATAFDDFIEAFDACFEHHFGPEAPARLPKTEGLPRSFAALNALQKEVHRDGGSA